MKIAYAKRETQPDRPTEIAWTASRNYIGRCLTYDGKERFIGKNHVQSVIKFGIDLVPAKPDEVPDAVRLHAEANMKKWIDENDYS